MKVIAKSQCYINKTFRDVGAVFEIEDHRFNPKCMQPFKDGEDVNTLLTIKVRASREGKVGGVYRAKGEVFSVDQYNFTPSWMEAVPKEAVPVVNVLVENPEKKKFGRKPLSVREEAPVVEVAEAHSGGWSDGDTPI